MIKNTYVIIAIVLSTFLLAEDWPAWRGSDGSGISKQTGILKSWKNGRVPKQIWRKSLGSGFSAISASKGILYTLYGDDKYEYCIALNAKSGKRIWARRLGYLYKRGHGDGPRSTPTIEGGRVYAVSAQGDLMCLNARNGKRVWYTNILRKFNAQNILWGVCSSPVIFKDRLLFNVGGQNGKSIVAFNKKTGAVIWTTGNDRAGYATPIFATIGSLTQAIFFTGNALLAVHPLNGKVLWRYKWKTDYDVNAAAPIYYKNRIFISSGYNTGAALIKVAPQDNNFTASLVWKSVRMKNHFSSSILWQGYIYGFHNKILSCIAFDTGKIMWRQRGFHKGTLVGVEGHMIILGERGTLALAKLSPHKYIEKGRGFPFRRAKYWTVPTVAYGKLFVRNEKEIMCLDLLDS